jgi:type III secretion system FlhB-like substrate exporter
VPSGPPKPPDEPRRATALHFDPASGASAPKVVATGRGLIADRILEEAERAGVPIRRDEALAAALAGLELGHEVPEELWVAVAEALAWAYGLDVKARRGGPGAAPS